ncbi:MAG: PilZ domain-containing protein [Parasphingorhabdus sp.]|uniref:PilZ domain-containing protein n=1 Tax=Parasphingorhabdus sp. TaxID=2709688 RepID=UPI003297AEBC
MTKSLENIELDKGQSVFREPRIRKLVKVELFSGVSGPYEAIVRNISTFGVRATSPIALRPGQSLEIVKKGFGKVSGTVRWIGENEFGMCFDEPIDIEQFNFESQNDRGHFVKKIDNGHVWTGFQTGISTKRPGFSRN